MIRFLQQCGIFGPPIVLLACVNTVLFVWHAVQLYRGRGIPSAMRETGLNAILFWGAISAVLGFLGQYSGIYNAVHAIVNASAISPRVVAIGFAESFTTTLLGLTVFVLSAIGWFVLHTWYQHRLARAQATGGVA